MDELLYIKKRLKLEIGIVISFRIFFVNFDNQQKWGKL